MYLDEKKQSSSNRGTMARHIRIQGRVQGVGFRPFVYGLARRLELSGWVRNDATGVELVVAGPPEALDEFLTRLREEKPPHAQFDHMEIRSTTFPKSASFEILPSGGGEKTAQVLPDLATCSKCLTELFDPNDRRYRYPFINCTHCGPRFSIIQALPYDRPHTTLADFQLCFACRREYEDPTHRRFHAQPNACGQCGPQLSLWDEAGHPLSSGDAALRGAADLIRQGKILALKGLGGFQFMVDARNEAAVQRLRDRKGRPHKPLALMFPNLQQAQAYAEISPLESRVLGSAEAPILLIHKRVNPLSESPLAPGLAPNLNWLGAMLPYTPLHHLLMHDLGFPVVATSGNRSEEPICIDEAEALERLGGIAEAYLVHDRPIARPVDDSVARVMAGELTLLRRARGYAPLSLDSAISGPNTLAVGAHLKNTIALHCDSVTWLSQHIGDLETLKAREAFSEVIQSFQNFYECQPERVVTDLHPGYASTQYGEDLGLPLQRVQHHHAHVLSLMAEHQLNGSVLGVAWDGTGYGGDGTLWGSEFLRVRRNDFQRLAHWRYFSLPGGERAVNEPRRMALALLFSIYGEQDLPWDRVGVLQGFSAQVRKILSQMLQQKIHAPLSCGMGRLFDAVAGLLGVCPRQSFEGQAAMYLETLAHASSTQDTYSLPIQGKTLPYVVDWEPMIREILLDTDREENAAVIAKKFHNTLTQGILDVVTRFDVQRVLLTGGCFQNKLLLESSASQLQEQGYQVYWHRSIPPNDGGIALGQIKAGETCV